MKKLFLVGLMTSLILVIGCTTSKDVNVVMPEKYISITSSEKSADDPNREVITTRTGIYDDKANLIELYREDNIFTDLKAQIPSERKGYYMVDKDTILETTGDWEWIESTRLEEDYYRILADAFKNLLPMLKSESASDDAVRVFTLKEKAKDIKEKSDIIDSFDDDDNVEMRFKLKSIKDGHYIAELSIRGHKDNKLTSSVDIKAFDMDKQSYISLPPSVMKMLIKKGIRFDINKSY